MSVVVRMTCATTDWTDPTEVVCDYGEIEDGLVTVAKLLEGSPYNSTILHTYVLSSDVALRYDATHVIALQLEVDPLVGPMFWLQDMIDGPFIFMLAQGVKLKGFHCDVCAKGFVSWLIEQQTFWKEKHHETRSQKDKAPPRQLH